MNSEKSYIAVDLGAGSGRVFLSCPGDDFRLEEVHRFAYPPFFSDGHLRWDFDDIFDQIKFGLAKAAELADVSKTEVYSLGIDSWAVDYGLIDERGELLANPVCYRDSRTENVREEVFRIISSDEIFAKTGIQSLRFNTIFQLFCEKQLDEATTILLLPDLLNYLLTGKKCAEYTNATTTQLVNSATGDWDAELLQTLGFDENKFPRIVQPGTDLGFLKPEIADELNLPNVRLVMPATHDTGSAVAGLPLEKNWAYISSGTWSLVGIEIDKPLINSDVARFNFTNEGGVDESIRFLKNVAGLWIFESCRREWRERGVAADYDNLLAEVRKIQDFRGFIYPDDERFLSPLSMLTAIENQMRETGQYFDENPAVIAKIILDSLAFRYASVIGTIENLTGEKIAGVQIAGGGGRNEYLNQMTANASVKAVKAGLAEATVTGNVLVQAIAAGRFGNLSEARKYAASKISLKTFEPQMSEKIEEARAGYQKIERFFLSAISAATS